MCTSPGMRGVGRNRRETHANTAVHQFPATTVLRGGGGVLSYSTALPLMASEDDARKSKGKGCLTEFETITWEPIRDKTTLAISCCVRVSPNSILNQLFSARAKKQNVHPGGPQDRVWETLCYVTVPTPISLYGS